MYVIVILNTNLLTLFSKRRPFNISDGKGKGNTWAYRDKIKVKSKKVKSKKVKKQKTLRSSRTAG
jgi:hypothetical protein